MEETPAKPSKRAAARAVKAERELRLKAALKVNIARRKAQARARSEDDPAEPSDEGPGTMADDNKTG